MILVDTSVWVNHFCRTNRALAGLLEENQVAVHPFVIGELACGNLPKRSATLRLLDALPRLIVLDDGAVLGFIEKRSLMGKGMGWIDAHLLASALVAGIPFWTADARLGALAATLGAGFHPAGDWN